MKVKKFNELNENIFFDDEEFETDNKELIDILDIDKMNTKITVDLEWYIEKAFKHVADFCIIYDIVPLKEIVDELVDDVKSHTEEYILYQDTEYTDWDSEYSFVIDNLIYLLEKKQPSEYEKYEKYKKTKEFNL